MSDDDTISDDPEQVLDLEALNADIAAGNKAAGHLLSHVAEDFSAWVITIRGFRGLRDLAFSKAQTRDIKSWHYRQELGALLQQRKNANIDRIMEKQTRSSCYKIMDRIDEIHTWYIGLPSSDQMRWKHPDSIAKHCPKHMLASGQRGHNKPKKIGKKKPLIDAEIERLKALLIRLIHLVINSENLAEIKREAAKLLDQITPQDPNDDLEGVFDPDPADADPDADYFAKVSEEGED